MGHGKEEVRKMLDRLPDESTYEDIQYYIYVREKIERGLKDIGEGRVLSQEEVERWMSQFGQWSASAITQRQPARQQKADAWGLNAEC